MFVAPFVLFLVAVTASGSSCDMFGTKDCLRNYKQTVGWANAAPQAPPSVQCPGYEAFEACLITVSFATCNDARAGILQYHFNIFRNFYNTNCASWSSTPATPPPTTTAPTPPPPTPAPPTPTPPTPTPSTPTPMTATPPTIPPTPSPPTPSGGTTGTTFGTTTSTGVGTEATASHDENTATQITGTMSIEVDDANAFVIDAQSKAAIAVGIADYLDIEPSMVSVTLTAAVRRLKARRLAGVNVAYTITFTSANSNVSSPDAVVTMLSEVSKPSSSASVAMEGALSSAVSNVVGTSLSFTSFSEPTITSLDTGTTGTIGEGTSGTGGDTTGSAVVTTEDTSSEEARSPLRSKGVSAASAGRGLTLGVATTLSILLLFPNNIKD